jgi:hypothetical protein
LVRWSLLFEQFPFSAYSIQPLRLGFLDGSHGLSLVWIVMTFVSSSALSRVAVADFGLHLGSYSLKGPKGNGFPSLMHIS